VFVLSGLGMDVAEMSGLSYFAIQIQSGILQTLSKSNLVACRGGWRTGRPPRASKSRGASKDRNYKNWNAV